MRLEPSSGALSPVLKRQFLKGRRGRFPSSIFMGPTKRIAQRGTKNDAFKFFYVGTSSGDSHRITSAAFEEEQLGPQAVVSRSLLDGRVHIFYTCVVQRKNETYPDQ